MELKNKVAVETAKETQETVQPIITQPISKPVGARDKNPSNWSILPTEIDGIIEAHNSNTPESFKGSMSDFNKFLRG